MARTQGRQGPHLRTGALHREQAFAQHQQALVGPFPSGGLQPLLQGGQVVVGKALQPGAAGADPAEQGVVDQSVGQHQAVTIRQGGHRRQVRLEAAGEQQHPLASQPAGQGALQLGMHRPAAAHQAGCPGSHPFTGGGGLGRGHQAGVAAQAEIVVAGQIQQGGCRIRIGAGGEGGRFQGAGGPSRPEAAQRPSPLRGDRGELPLQVVTPLRAGAHWAGAQGAGSQ